MYRSESGAPRHDIAILETTSDLYTQGSQSAPACIPPLKTALEDMMGSPGKCYVAGFGTTEWQGEASEQLRSINVNIYSDRICQAGLNECFFQNLKSKILSKILSSLIQDSL